MTEFIKNEAYILLGPPGSGKSSLTKDLVTRTQAQLVRGRDICPPELRKAHEAKRVMILDEQFIPPLVSKLEGLTAEGVEKIVFDNIPRTHEQAVVLVGWANTSGFRLNTILLSLTEAEVFNRALNRFICPQCENSYHPQAKPAIVDGYCDLDGLMLVRRIGDREENLTHAYSQHQATVEEVVPVLSVAGNLHQISASGTVHEVTRRVFDSLFDPEQSLRSTIPHDRESSCFV